VANTKEKKKESKGGEKYGACDGKIKPQLREREKKGGLGGGQEVDESDKELVLMERRKRGKRLVRKKCDKGEEP